MTELQSRLVGEDSINTFYHEADNGQFVPRALFIDLEPSVIGIVRYFF